MRVFGRGKRWFEQTEESEHQQGGYCEGMSGEGWVGRDRSTYKMQSYKDRMTRRLTTRVCARYVWQLAKRGSAATPAMWGTMVRNVEDDERTRFGAVADDRRQR